MNPSGASKALCARGKSIFLGDEKLYVRGVTYGTFRSDGNGDPGGFPDPEMVSRDFEQMAENGINALRTYTVPPTWLLDLAQQHGLFVMVGIPWEEHITFLDEPGRASLIKERIRSGVRACAGHPGVLCYAIGNEIPASIVRWHGRHKIERFLHALYREAKAEDPGALVTYVNYPTTEYLQLPFIDLVCFNIFLESGPQFEAYLARLQNIAGERPLIVTEIGLDSLRHNQETQAAALDWQVRSAFASGCAGVFVFSWTDEWYRGGFDVDDWEFGLVSREREPKLALDQVRQAFDEIPFRNGLAWPKISVVVCTYNDEETIADCFEGLRELRYPDFEVIVVNDGSTDATPELIRKYGFRMLGTENKGLANARNLGLEAASGEIVAYLDADARPDPHWLSYLAFSFLRSSHAGIGGPNIPPPEDGDVADCVAKAPGGPIHVLLSDREAEHIPGCNMAFRTASLKAIGGFDPQFRVAGDDVDICWRLQQQGWTVGFSPGAVVWHHRRGSVRAYLKQQYHYGKAEALLERKWPDRYNRVGHLAWAGRVYGTGAPKTLGWRRWKIYYGTWGTGLFQSIYQRAPSLLESLPLMPEWYLVLFALAAISALGVAVWSPLLVAVPFFVVALAALIFEASLGAARASFPRASGSRWGEWRLRSLTALLFVLQPVSRLAGRLRHGLTPWRRRPGPTIGFPRPRTISTWSEQWRSQDERLAAFEDELRAQGGTLNHGTEYDRWDLEVRGGVLGTARMRMAVEEHGAGRQLVRIRSWPHLSRAGAALIATSTVLAAAAAVDSAWIACGLLGMSALVLIVTALWDCATATGIMLRALDHQLETADVVRIEETEPLWIAAPWVRARGHRNRDNGARRREAEHARAEAAAAAQGAAEREPRESPR